MSKYINADEFLHYYGILISQPDFNPQSAEIETWKLWKKWFDKEVVKLVSQMATKGGIDIVRCKDCKYREMYEIPIQTMSQHTANIFIKG